MKQKQAQIYYILSHTHIKIERKYSTKKLEEQKIQPSEDFVA